ncbi:MAG: hypothetical protein H7Y31_02725 [Chitinophagaceae bacterium]|nr:hypothetical protein [Chitinophagaceae bacterium]
MKFLAAIILTALIAFVAGLYLPWWSIALASFFIAIIIEQRPAHSFWSGALGIFLVWGLLALIIDSKNHGILSQRIASIFPLGGSSLLLILVTAVLGALVGALAALSGAYLRRLILDNRR